MREKQREEGGRFVDVWGSLRHRLDVMGVVFWRWCRIVVVPESLALIGQCCKLVHLAVACLLLPTTTANPCCSCCPPTKIDQSSKTPSSRRR